MENNVEKTVRFNFHKYFQKNGDLTQHSFTELVTSLFRHTSPKLTPTKPQDLKWDEFSLDENKINKNENEQSNEQINLRINIPSNNRNKQPIGMNNRRLTFAPRNTRKEINEKEDEIRAVNNPLAISKNK